MRESGKSLPQQIQLETQSSANNVKKPSGPQKLAELLAKNLPPSPQKMTLEKGKIQDHVQEFPHDVYEKGPESLGVTKK